MHKHKSDIMSKLTHAEQRLDLDLQFALEMITTLAQSGILSDELSDSLHRAVGSIEEDRRDVIRLIGQRKLELPE